MLLPAAISAFSCKELWTSRILSLTLVLYLQSLVFDTVLSGIKVWTLQLRKWAGHYLCG